MSLLINKIELIKNFNTPCLIENLIQVRMGLFEWWHLFVAAATSSANAQCLERDVARNESHWSLREKRFMVVVTIRQTNCRLFQITDQSFFL